MATFSLMFLVNDIIVCRDKTVPRYLNYGVRDARAVYVFRCFCFNHLKSSWLEDSIPVHALDVFIENATKMV